MTDTAVETAIEPMYRLRLDLCVLEVTFTRFRLPLARARFELTDGVLMLDEPAELTLKAATKPLRANMIVRRRWGTRPRRLKFQSHSVESVEPNRLRIAGVLTNLGKEHELTLHARIVHRDDDSIVISARGALPGAKIELAGEFTS